MIGHAEFGKPLACPAFDAGLLVTFQIWNLIDCTSLLLKDKLVPPVALSLCEHLCLPLRSENRDESTVKREL